MARIGPIVAAVILNLLFGGVNTEYRGKSLGRLSELHHGVSGEVFAVDSRTLHIKDFTYDGQGPAAYFYASKHRAADNRGFRLRDENNSGDVIRRYRKEDVTLTLPEGTLKDIKIFYVWCEEFSVNFGDVKIPKNFDFPRPQKIDALKGVHGVSSDNIVIVDAQTLLIPNLSYDGEAPDAKFWVGKGPKPSPQGIRVPDENGKEAPLRRYDRKTVVLTLPGDLTVADIGHFGIWCEAFTVDFGHILIPQGLNVPPSLKMLGVSPQSKLNCEVLHDDLAFEVRWAVAGESIVLQLVAKLDKGEYMSFGISGDEQKSVMIGGDVVVAWVDKNTLKGFAEDYYLDAKSQCSGPSGSCPDNRLAENTNNIRLLNAAMVNGYSIITYQRPLKASDSLDKPIYVNQSQAIIWAIGPLNQRNEVSFHSSYTKGDQFLDFGRPAKWNCPMPETDQSSMKQAITQTRQKIIEEAAEAPTTSAPRSRNNERRRGSNRGSTKQEDSEKSATKPQQQTRTRSRGTQRGSTNRVPTPAPVSKRNAWEIPPIQCYEPEDGVFYAQMGPTGGKRGYPAITGHVGWGISWYINGLLIPEINVVRGKTYTFVVEGGFDPEIPAKYHPFYITDDPVGGYEYKTPEEKKSIKIFAGATSKDGNVVPTGTGRLCHWTQQGDLEADDFDSFGAYQRTLELKCDQGEPGVIQWTPDKNTPDTVYYQCFTHRYLGWKINVLDSCDGQAAASEPKGSVVEAPEGFEDKLDEDIEQSPSIRIETRVKPNDLYRADKEGQQSPLLYPISELNPKIPPERNYYGRPETIPIHRRHPNQTKQPYRFEKPNLTDRGEVPIPSIKRPVSLRPRPYYTPHFQNYKIPMRIQSYKKPIFKPFRPPSRPYYFVNPPKISQMQYKPIPSKAPNLTESQPVTPHIDIEISPQQASTEKEPETFEKPQNNSGFQPSSIIMETGFKPMIKKEQDFQMQIESELGYLLPNQKKFMHFGKKPIYKRAKSFEDSDNEAAAAERIESYYLPPADQPKPKEIVQQPSNIDIETPDLDLASPPDIVVTYDGKRVSGASLTVKMPGRTNILDMRASKAAEFIKARPQFVPFKGELPPLNPVYFNTNAPQLQAYGSINRDLDTPLDHGSTKLSRVSPVEEEDHKGRNKRAAHHTPEHTAEQNNQTLINSSSSISFSCFYALIVVYFLRYL